MHARICLRFLLLLALPSAALATSAAQPAARAGAIRAGDARDRGAVLDTLAAKLAEAYVFPDVAALAGRRLASERRRLLGIAGADEFAVAVQRLLTEVAHDRHIDFRHDPREYERLTAPPRMEQPPAPEAPPGAEPSFTETSDGFRRVELLDGNIGYLDLDLMADATARSGARAAAAMAFLGEPQAVIVDLRRNPGGSGRMNQLLSSYFFAESDDRLLIRNENRSAGTNVQEWTLTYVPGRRLPDVPLYFLVDANTGSAAEGFAYNLQALGRAKVVGEPTAGGAHSGRTIPLAQGFVIFLPTGRTVNPITNGNWEGTGVRPDLPVRADLALDQALHHIWTARSAAAPPGSPRADHARWQLAYYAARLQPAPMPADAADFAGAYGADRRITLVDGQLYYQFKQVPANRLLPLADGSFVLEGRDYFGPGNVRVRFVRGAGGQVERAQFLTRHPYSNFGTSDVPRSGPN